MTTEERELKLVDTVEFRILGVANNEAKLQDLLGKYLAPLLLKAASEHASVRSKVITVCHRLKTFVQAPGVVLPVTALLEQYKSTRSPIIKQLDLTFILHSTPRLDAYDRGKLVPKLIQSIALDTGNPTQSGIFNVLLSVLSDLSLPSRGSKEDEVLRESLGLSDPQDAIFVADWLGKILLLKNVGGDAPSLDNWLAQNPTLTRSELHFLKVTSPEGRKIFVRITELKSKIVSLLACGAFSDEEKFLPAIYAASAPDSRVCSIGEDLLRRTTVSLENEELVKRLFAAHSHLPAAHRTRILTLLSRSTKATAMDAEILKVVELDFIGMERQDDGVAVSVPAHQEALVPKSVLERTKLHRALFQFLSWTAKNSSSRGSFEAGPALVQKMKDYIELQGWPVPSNTSADDMALRATAYDIMGALFTLNGKMSNQDAKTLAGWLFRSLSEDPCLDVVVNINAALSSLAPTIDYTNFSFVTGLQGMLLHYMLLPDDPPVVRSVRHAAVKWANRCLPFSDSGARWIDILAVAGRVAELSDVTEEGRKGLDPWSHFAHAETKPKLPSWTALTSLIFNTEIKPQHQIGAEGAMDIDPDAFPDLLVTQGKSSTAKIFRNFPGHRIAAFTVALTHIKQMLFLDALDGFEIDPNWEVALDARIRNDNAARAKVKSYLESIDEAHTAFILAACLEGLVRNHRPIAEDCGSCLVDIVTLAPQGAIACIASRADELLPFAMGSNKKVQSLAARAFGILASHPINDAEKQIAYYNTLAATFPKWTTAFGTELSAVEGSLLAYAYLTSRLVYCGQPIPEHFRNAPLLEILDKNHQGSLRTAAIEAMGHIWGARFALSDGTDFKDSVIKSLSKDAKNGDEMAIWALGRYGIAMEEPDSTDPDNALTSGSVGSLLTELFALYELRQIEVHFAVGEAIAAAVACWDSTGVQLNLDVDTQNTKFASSKRSARVKAVLDKLFADCKATKPSLLKASGIWLFCMVQYCSHLDEVKSRLREVQVAFMRLLGARDELVQETASRGLSLVHERGDESVRADLVKDLVSAFTGSGTQLKVDDETELFEPGALATGDGQSVTSYKDIVNLAQEVGDQSLIYKFMSLASNAATWATRSAFGRFGLNTILSESEVDPKLYSKLFRYRFDPNTNVQRSMNDIWKALVKDEGAVMNAHFDAIMDDLLRNVLGREWRVRQASCAAISDLVAGRPFEKYEKYYGEIWRVGAKVIDDIKSSVREAAMKMCITLSKTLVTRLEESGESKNTVAMMKEAMPFLLSENGVESGVWEAQIFAIATVLKITNTGGKALKPFISTMIPQLLGLLSTIEPAQINYGYQRAGIERREALDRMRSAMVRTSPISDAIDDCLRNVDAGVLSEMIPRFLETVKTAIGMPTKIGCSRVLVTLYTRHAQTAKPFAADLLRLMEKQTLDSNDEVSKGYAQASAYIIRAAPDDSQQSFINKFITMYFACEDENRRHKVSDVMVAISKISPDQFSHNEGLLLPFSYLGSHDTDEYTRKAFKEVWEQHAGSAGRTVARYTDEICALAERALDAALWDLRHTGAGTTGAVVEDVIKGTDLGGQIAESRAKKIWPVLERSLALKTFDGKEKVLDAFPLFVGKARCVWSEDESVANTMEKIAIREARRNNNAYKEHAFRNLWKFARARPDLSILDTIADVVRESLDEWADENTMDVDEGDKGTRGSGSVDKEKLAVAGLEAVARGWNPSTVEKTPVAALAKVVALLKPYLTNARFLGIRRRTWYSAVEDLMTTASDKAGSPSLEGDVDLVLVYLEGLDTAGAASSGAESQRILRAKAVLATSKAVQTGVFGVLGDDARREVKAIVGRMLEEERSADVKEIVNKAMNMLV